MIKLALPALLLLGSCSYNDAFVAPKLLMSRRAQSPLAAGWKSLCAATFPNGKFGRLHKRMAATAEDSLLIDQGGPAYKIEVNSFNQFLKGAAWFSWWAQVVLTTVAAVILYSAGTIDVVDTAADFSVFLMDGFFAATLGVITSAFSVLWTWGIPNAGMTLKKKTISPGTALATLRTVLRGAAVLNLLGLAVSFVGAQQFVGTLILRVLAAGSTNTQGQVVKSALVRPVDVFVVQANTNTLLSHFVSLTTSLILLVRYGRLERALAQPDMQPEENKQGTNLFTRILGRDFLTLKSLKLANSVGSGKVNSVPAQPVEAEATAPLPPQILPQSSLPLGWEERFTTEGRPFYVDHNTRTTSWERPSN